MSFRAQVQCENGAYYNLKGEGGYIHVYNVEFPSKGLGKGFKSVAEAFEAIAQHEGSNVDGDTYNLQSGDDSDY